MPLSIRDQQYILRVFAPARLSHWKFKPKITCNSHVLKVLTRKFLSHD